MPFFPDLTALRKIREGAAGEREGSYFFLAESDCEAHGVAVDMTGVAGWGGRYVLVPAHGAAMLSRESACDIEIAMLIEHYGLRNLAT
jgi:hypothetical protein